MFSKVILCVCAQAFLMQSIVGQCMGAGLAAPLAAAPYTAAAAPWAIAGAPCGAMGPNAAASWGAASYGIAYGPGPAAAAASHGGGLPTASASAIPPNGVALVSENAYEGALAVAGAVPFLGTVALEGALPTAGAGAVAYGCGNGEVAMLAEGTDAAGPLGYGIGPYGYGIGARAYEAPLAGPLAGPFGRAGCGCGANI